MTDTTILIVDDEAAIREMIAVALERVGYQTLEASDSQQALFISRAGCPVKNRIAPCADPVALVSHPGE